MEEVVKSYGDRFADVVENAKVHECVSYILPYAEEIAKNDDGDIEAQNCVKVLKSIPACTADAIGNAIA